MSTLYLVATPIGNLEDISARALRVLKEVKLIAAEDTRHSAKLLLHFDIHTPMTSYFEHNKKQKLDNVLETLEDGNVALISDAGTPGLNDPGYLLVNAALEAGHEVSPIPGPSAPIAALVSSGLPTDKFLYLGYLPRKSGERRRFIEVVAGLPYTLVLLETPHRLDAALEDLLTILGDREAAAASELTKMYEEISRGSLSELQANFAQSPARGEFTLVIAGASETTAQWTEAQVDAALEAGLADAQPPANLAKQIAAESGWPRRQVYRKITSLQSKGKQSS